MDCKNFHLDQVVHRFWPQVKIVKVQGETAGAVCSALLAINHLLLSEPLLIVNGDHLLEADLIGMIEETKNRKASGGVVVFESINPRFSYVRIDEHGWVDEVAEKKPISRNATAGVYYYSTAQLFIQSAVSLIKKQAHFGGRYYIAPCFNEVILRGGSVFAFKIPSQSYKPLSPINIPINREAP
jgi:dTDP-glucose pyrophosphorylase